MAQEGTIIQAQQEIMEQIQDLELDLPKVQQFVLVPQNNEDMLLSKPSFTT
jgi:hypothetical protein